MPQVDVSRIEDISRAALVAHGAPSDAAAVMAGAVAWAEARGNRICGLYYLESYCQQLRSGRVDGGAEPIVTHRRPASLHVDGADGFAQTAFLAGLPAAVRAAREYGTATMAVGRCHTCTALGWFTEGAAREGLVALGTTNASPIVAPPGGTGRVIGTNPVAFAVPDGAGGIAMAFDQATTQVALGAVTMAKAAGEPIPEGWAFDADGRPTTDPDAALRGSLASAGGAKGWGIGLMAEILTVGLGGGRASADVRPLKAPEGAPHDLGMAFMLIDPTVAPDFAERVRALAEAVEAAGGRMPGRDRVTARSVEVPEGLWQTVERLAEG